MIKPRFVVESILVLAVMALAGTTAVAASPTDLAGPLRVLSANPRYFTDGSGRAVYLTGEHTWPVFKDMGPGDPPPVFDYPGYLRKMTSLHHNFLRLWTWDLFQYTYADDHGKMEFAQPFPWPRIGPGLALDGKPKFDLTKFNQAFFDRLRQRVLLARDAGIYVSVMLFEGHGVQVSEQPWCWDGHPLNKANNINGLDGNPGGKERGVDIYTLNLPEVTRIQEAYVRKVIDTLNDLNNVLYEVSNESGDYSTAWQYHIIRFVKASERNLPKQHPVGMTYQYKGGHNETLFASPADWISPSPDGGYKEDPPAADGSKVVLTDTDHLWGDGGTALWVWKSFLRGLNPIYMDDSTRDDPERISVRQALGYTLDMARRIGLAKMTPHGDLASTGYCLANPGVEYLALQTGKGPLTVTLPREKRTYTVDWFDVTGGKEIPAETVAASATASFVPPFDGPAVLHLELSGR